MQIKTLDIIYNKKENSFNDLRFILATSVLFYHSYEMLPTRNHDFFTSMMNGQLSLGGLAVYAFFVLSGFFMIQSLQNAKCKMQNAKCKMQNAKCKMQNAKCKMQNAKWVGYYFLNRILRILPAFWFSLFLFSFIVIPIFSDINFRDAFHFTWKAGTFHFFDYAWEIHNAYPNNFLKDNVNGSMWTLKHELACYIVLPIIYFLCYGKRILLLTFNVILLILVILSLSINYALWTIPVGIAWIISINEYHSFILFFYYFMTGVNLYLYRDKIIVSKRWLVALCVLFLFFSFWGGLKYVLLLTLPYFFVVLGSLLKTNIFSRKGDFSYGMYIYAFPIQQILINFLVDISPLQLTMYSLILTVILSIFSWFFIEKPFLKMKSFR